MLLHCTPVTNTNAAHSMHASPVLAFTHGVHGVATRLLTRRAPSIPFPEAIPAPDVRPTIFPSPSRPRCISPSLSESMCLRCVASSQPPRRLPCPSAPGGAARRAASCCPFGRYIAFPLLLLLLDYFPAAFLLQLLWSLPTCHCHGFPFPLSLPLRFCAYVPFVYYCPYTGCTNVRVLHCTVCGQFNPACRICGVVCCGSLPDSSWKRQGCDDARRCSRSQSKSSDAQGRGGADRRR